MKEDQSGLQQRLFVSLSEILETRREARGLIVNLSDVLFDSNRATLKPGAREKLSKLAGILLAYTGSYRMEIEGHTDSVGSQDYNQKLSEDRAEAVHDGYRVVVVPPMADLADAVDHRVFLQQDAAAIVEEVLRARYLRVERRLSRPLPARPQCVQFFESVGATAYVRRGKKLRSALPVR